MIRFIKDVSSVGLSKFLIILFKLVNGIIIARKLGPEANGVIAALAVYPSIFMAIGSLGIRQATTYFVGKNLYSDSEIKQSIIYIWMFSCFLSVTISFFLIRNFSSNGGDLLLVIFAVLPIPFSLFNQYSSGIFLGQNRIQSFNKINWIPNLLTLVFTVLLIVLFSFDVSGVLIANIIGVFTVSVIFLVKENFIATVNSKPNLKLIKEMLSLGLIYALALLVINMNYKMDVILLDKLSTNYETGIYTKGANIMQYLWQIPMLLSTIIFARSAVSKNDKAFSYKVSQLLRISLVLIGIGSIILFILSPYLIPLMYGREFQDSSVVLQYLLPGVLFLTFFKVLNMDLAGKGMPWVSLKAMVPALIINIFLNVIWIPELGSQGAALASTISYSVAAILFLIFYSKAVDIPIIELIRYSKEDLMIIQKLKQTITKKLKKN